MNLQQLEYIHALDKYRHFGRAADHCQVTQPTLSTMIQKLEEELGVKIFDRSHLPIQPTAVGRLILDQAALILRQTEQLREVIHQEYEALSGTVRLAVLPTIAPYLLPRLLPLVRKELPELRLEITELKTSDCLEELIAGEQDLAIIATASQREELLDQPLYYEEFAAYVSPNSPLYKEEHIRSSEVGKQQLWLLDEGHCFRDQLVKFCQLAHSTRQQISYHRGSLETFMHLVDQGDGVTFRPQLATEMLPAERRSQVKPFALPRPTRAVTLVRHREYVRQRLVEVLSTLIQASVPESMLQLTMEQDLV